MVIHVNAIRDDESEARRQINADVTRTVPSSDVAQWTSTHTESLRRVLVAYALHDSHLGYCQGLNFIVAKMLLCMEEEEAFWLLVKLIDRLPNDYYTTMVCISLGCIPRTLDGSSMGLLWIRGYFSTLYILFIHKYQHICRYDTLLVHE